MLCANPGERSKGRGLSWLALHAFVALFMVAMAAAAAAQPLGVAERASSKAIVPDDEDDDAVCEPGWVSTFGATGISISGFSPGVLSFAKAADGSSLYFGGVFSEVGGVAANRVAKWDGEAWSAVGDGFTAGVVFAMAEFDAGQGPELYAGGDSLVSGGQRINGVARWDGDAWIGLPIAPLSGVAHSPSARGLVVFDDGSGPALYAAGRFDIGPFQGGFTVGRWDGSTWSPLPGLTGWGLCITVFDDGMGPALYAGGLFGVQRWDGQGWSMVGGETPLDIGARFTVVEESDGPRLYASASTIGDGIGIYRLDDHRWTRISDPLDETVTGMRSFDDGGGPALYVGVRHRATHESPATTRIRKWDGSVWSEFATFTPHSVIFGIFVDDAERSLYAVGNFTDSPAGDAYIARYQGCPPPPCPADLNADGVVDVTDLRTLLLNKGPCPQRGACVGDLDGDGAVTGRDVALLVQAFGVCP